WQCPRQPDGWGFLCAFSDVVLGRFLLPPAPISGNLPSPVNTRLFLLLSLVALFAACETTPKKPVEIPLTLKTFPAAYSDYAMELSDSNKDGEVTLIEWTNAGGDRRSFLLADQNKDGVVT